MAKDHKKFGFEQHDELPEDELGHEEETEAIDEGDEPSFEQPICPRCGWHNTRPSHTLTMLDMAMRMIGMSPWRCRACGNRFRTKHRANQAED
jgi:hypothetical protein